MPTDVQMGTTPRGAGLVVNDPLRQPQLLQGQRSGPVHPRGEQLQQGLHRPASPLGAACGEVDLGVDIDVVGLRGQGRVQIDDEGRVRRGNRAWGDVGGVGHHTSVGGGRGGDAGAGRRRVGRGERFLGAGAGLVGRPLEILVLQGSPGWLLCRPHEVQCWCQSFGEDSEGIAHLVGAGPGEYGWQRQPTCGEPHLTGPRTQTTGQVAGQFVVGRDGHRALLRTGIGAIGFS